MRCICTRHRGCSGSLGDDHDLRRCTATAIGCRQYNLLPRFASNVNLCDVHIPHLSPSRVAAAILMPHQAPSFTVTRSDFVHATTKFPKTPKSRPSSAPTGNACVRVPTVRCQTCNNPGKRNVCYVALVKLVYPIRGTLRLFFIRARQLAVGPLFRGNSHVQRAALF